MNEQHQKLKLYLDKQITDCIQRCKLLTAENRMDEGNFEKVRANVYEIFKTILSAAEKVYGTDNIAEKRFFLEKADQIPKSWTASYDNAKQHGDIEKMHMESIKLDTVREIKDICMQIWEETI